MWFRSKENKSDELDKLDELNNEAVHDTDELEDKKNELEDEKNGWRQE